jgi:type VI secretion system protein ImpL
VAFLTIAILLGVLSAANGHLMGRTRRAAQEVARQVRPDAPFMENLATLEELRSRVETVDSLSRRKPLWRWLGGYAGDVLRDPALQLYVEKSLETLVAPSVHEMEASLARLTDSKQGEFIRYYYMFRAWRLLSEPKQIQPEDASILAREMGNALNPRIAYASPADRERFPALMRKQVEFLAAHADWVARLAPAYYRLGNPDLVARAADRVRSTWDSSQFYRLMIDEVRPLAAPATLESLAGGGGGLLNGTYEVPGAYTKEGWEQQIKPRVEWYRVQMQRDWVVADAFRPKPAPDLAHDILALYARDYSGQWVSFLNSLNVANPRDLAGAAEMLKSAAQDDSPILKVLRAVSEQTELGADPRSELGQVQNDFEIVHDFFQAPESAGGAKRVTSFFARFFQKPKVGPGGNVLDRNQAPSDLYKAQLKAAAENVLSAAQPGAAASEIRKLMAVGDESTNPLKQVMAWAEGLAASYSGGAAAQPTMRLLQLPITGAREAARGGMRPELNSKWNLLVVTPFQKTLAGRYPMVAEGADAALFDFAEFFRPGGTFWSFYEAELKEYVLEDGTPRDPESASGLSPQLIECLRKAHDIREAFFSTDPNAPKLRFSVRAKPPSIEGPAVVRWVSFDVGGQFATYSMGVQQWMPLEWPGTDQGAGAAVRAQAKDGPQPEGINATGPWGLFHVLDRGQLGQTGGNPSVTWRLAAGQSRILVSYEIQPSSARHPFLDGFLRFSLPASL